MIWSERQESSFSFLCVDNHFSQHHLLRRLSAPVFFVFFFKDQIAVAVLFYFWVFYSVPLVFMSDFVPVPCWFCYQYSIIHCDTPQCCSFCSVLLMLFGLFYAFIWILGLIFLFLQRVTLEFWWALHWICFQ
jgi:hypothetical protein